MHHAPGRDPFHLSGNGGGDHAIVAEAFSQAGDVVNPVLQRHNGADLR